MLHRTINIKSSRFSRFFPTVDAALQAHYAAFPNRRGTIVANAKNTAAPLISGPSGQHRFELFH
jgi:hypothetical protein